METMNHYITLKHDKMWVKYSILIYYCHGLIGSISLSVSSVSMNSRITNSIASPTNNVMGRGYSTKNNVFKIKIEKKIVILRTF